MLTNCFNGYPIHLIESVEELYSAVAQFDPKVFVGIDTETHSLTYAPGQVVGICLSGGSSYSTSDYHGYYIPLRHREYNNLPISEVISVVQNLLDNYQTVFFNRNFDASQLEFDGIKVPFVGKMHDAQVMCFLVFNEHYPSLKEYTKNILKWKVIDFETMTGGDHDFGNSDPRVSYIYAAGDPVMTVILARAVWSRYPDIRKIYSIDNYALEAVRRMMQQTLTLDYDFVQSEYDRTSEKLRSIQEQIYSITGVYGFNIGSAKEKADVLSRFVTLTKKTKSGGFATDADTLQSIDHPVAKLMVQWNETRTYLNSFLKKILTFKGRDVRINYSTVNVASGRLSSGASKGNDYYVPLNIQNQPKLEEKLYVHHHEYLGYCLKREREGCVLDKEGNPCKLKTKTGLHEAYITGDPDWVWLTGDYAGQEMKLAANFSGEPNFLDPMLAGADIHGHVAKSMFGFFDPDSRTRVKILNFSCLYGAEGPTIAQRIGVSREEGCSLFDHYKRTMSRLYKWKALIVANAKRKGYAFTYFGRPIYLLKYFNSADRGMRSYAERLSVNATIQGSLPARLFLPSQDGKYYRSMLSHIGKEVLYAENELGFRHYGTPTYRGVDQLIYVELTSGDFVVCSKHHKFLADDGERLLSIPQAIDTPVKLISPHRKLSLVNTIVKLLTKRTAPMLSLLSPYVAHDRIPVSDYYLAASLLWGWISRKRYILPDKYRAAVFRSAIDLYGWNLVTTRSGKYKLKWSRARKSKASNVASAGRENVVSPCMVSGYQTYPLAGFIHKNTGGDLIRIALVKFEKLRDIDPEYRAKTKFQITVHDECNFSVHRTYLYKAWKTMCKVMNFFPSNFKVPITIDAGVGAKGWGDCLDFQCVSTDNRVIPNGFDPDNFTGQEREYLIDIIKHCKVGDLPDNLKKYCEE